MILTFVSTAFAAGAIASQKIIFFVILSAVGIIFAICWAAFSRIDKKNRPDDYIDTSPDLEGRFMRWMLDRIKKFFR